MFLALSNFPQGNHDNDRMREGIKQQQGRVEDKIHWLGSE